MITSYDSLSKLTWSTGLCHVTTSLGGRSASSYLALFRITLLQTHSGSLCSSLYRKIRRLPNSANIIIHNRYLLIYIFSSSPKPKNIHRGIDFFHQFTFDKFYCNRQVGTFLHISQEEQDKTIFCSNGTGNNYFPLGHAVENDFSIIQFDSWLFSNKKKYGKYNIFLSCKIKNCFINAKKLIHI